jgi:DNA-binding XRE family transcriptional regulator
MRRPCLIWQEINPNLGYLSPLNYDAAVPKTLFTSDDDSFREQLRELRINRSVTQAELAGLLGQPQSYVSKYETGERRLDFVETHLVCQALGASIESFAREFTRRAATRKPRVKNRRKREAASE